MYHVFQFSKNAETRKSDNKRVFTTKPRANSISSAVCLADFPGPGFHKILLMLPGKPQTSVQCPSWSSMGHGGEHGVRCEQTWSAGLVFSKVSSDNVTGLLPPPRPVCSFLK